jgi:hypothetical protein
MHSANAVMVSGRITRRTAKCKRKPKKDDAQLEALTQVVRQLTLQRRRAGKTCGRSLRQPNMGFIETDEDQDSAFPLVTVGRTSPKSSTRKEYSTNAG